MMLGGLGLWGKSERRGAMPLSTCRLAHLNIICKVTLVLTLKSQEALSAVHVVDKRQLDKEPNPCFVKVSQNQC